MKLEANTNVLLTRSGWNEMTAVENAIFRYGFSIKVHINVFAKFDKIVKIASICGLEH